MRSLLTAGLAAGLLMSTSALAQDTAGDAAYDASTVLATVDGTEITLGHVIAMQERLPQQYKQLPDETLLEGILEQLVDQTLLSQQVSESPDSDPLAVKLQMDNERRGALAAREVESRMADPVDEAAVKAAYDEFTASFEPQPEFDASHILVDSEEKANEIKETVEGGGDFAELAKENSSDGSAAEGGSLGWFGMGQMVPEFEQAVAGMEVGAVAGPVESQFGWHVIKLNDKRDSSPPEFEQIRPEIEAQIRQERLKEAVEELRSEADIELPEVEVPATAIRDGALLQN